MTVFVEPRLSLEYKLSERVGVKAAWGLYHQAPVAEDLSSVFGNPALASAKGNHWLFGFQFHLSDTVSEEMTFFYSTSNDLAVRNSATTLPTAEALVSTGLGRVFGGQILLRKELSSRFFGWLSYTLLRSERAAAEGEPYHLFDFDQTHVLTAVASYDLGRDFEIGVRGRYASGYPRTPVTGTYSDTVTDSTSPRFGPQNGIRIPGFFQADVRLSKKFRLPGSIIEAYVDSRERHQPKEPRGDRVRQRLQRAPLHDRAPASCPWPACGGHGELEQ